MPTNHVLAWHEILKSIKVLNSDRFILTPLIVNFTFYIQLNLFGVFLVVNKRGSVFLDL